MPGLLCSVFDAADASVAARWQRSLELVRHHPGHVLDEHAEPGFRLACLYHPRVCAGPRLLVTEDFVLACYGNLYEDDLPNAGGEALCRALLEKFLARGPAALQHLNDRYDIAVWDRRARVLHFVGDRFGANRHYLLERSRALHVACEVKALAVFQERVEVDPGGLASMLSFGHHLGDLTLVQGIRCLPNARRLEYVAAQDRLTITRYWDHPYGEYEPLRMSEAELAEALHSRLAAALERRLARVKKLLLPISGGLDSRTLAGLLAQSGFSGEVLAYSYGQPGSRDVRYGRAIARALGFPHVTIPTPRDFITRHLGEDAWRHDAEWSAELNWGVRFAHADSALDSARDGHVLSGMYGDMVLGSDKFHYRRRLGDAPLSLERLRAAYYACHLEYGSLEAVLALFDGPAAAVARGALDRVIDEELRDKTHQAPWFALTRAEFAHRQRRQTAMVAQAIEYERPAITPFLDREVVELALRVPYEALHDKRLYAQMIRTQLPSVAKVAYEGSGLALAPGRVRAGLHWRAQRVLGRLPGLARRLAKRAALFDFHAGIVRERRYFEAHAELLRALAPPLALAPARARYDALITGRAGPADQACAFLPPAVFVSELRGRLAGAASPPAVQH